jgi:exodeoxyribonuclease V gamma subunit
MRSIPFKVVALLGMNDGEFPRSPQPLEIDLIAKGERRLGDRSRRDDDRYLFLETVCAVRERLIVTYSGQSTRDNRRRPPSVCVSELLGYLAERCAAPIESFVIEHKLQGFHPEYFQSHAPSQGNPALFSYAESYAKAAERTLLARQQQRVFFAGKLEPPDNEQLDIEELVRFFRSPAESALGPVSEI